MNLDELKAAIEGEGFNTGYDLSTEGLIIMTKGYKKIGEIKYEKPFDVILNLHHSRSSVTEENKNNIYKAILEFVSTPIEDRKRSFIPILRAGNYK